MAKKKVIGIGRNVKQQMHPSGPGLPGHPKCGKGEIYDHEAGKCISILKYKERHPFRKESIWED